MHRISESAEPQSRRGALATILMGVGVLSGYGLGLVHFFRYLVPLGRSRERRQMFVSTLAAFPVGSSRTVHDPGGREINIVRIADDPDQPARGFKALSSKCPHLGCRVHWEEANHRFFCPCHQGVFSKEGIALEGPPAKEGKNLPTYEIAVDPVSGWVMVMVTPETTYGV